MAANNYKHIKIALADDDKDDKELFHQCLIEANLDFALTTFEDGNKFYSYLSQTEEYPDIVFLDINMPGINGIECLKNIKGNNNFQNLPP